MSPREVFLESVADAECLLRLALMLSNGRERRMRVELRERLGDALGFARKHRDGLDCVESDHLFVILKPNGVAERAQFEGPSLVPLLRHAVVATSAAVEAYVADKASSYVATALAADELPARLNDLTLGLRDVVELDRAYTRRGWGYRDKLLRYISDIASPAPGSIGKTFSTVGVRVNWAQVDGLRRVEKGTSERQLEDLYARRNRIAHGADRSGTTRATLSLDETSLLVRNVREVIDALDRALPVTKEEAPAP